MTLKELFTAIANAIRGKKDTTAKIKASNFPQEIETIITKGEPYVFATEAQMDTFLGSTKAKDGDIVLYTGTTGTKYVNSKYYQIVKPVGEDGEYSIISTYLQEKTITPTKSNQIVEASGGYNGLSKVNVNAIPSDYIIPEGNITIEENGTKDVAQFKNAVINVKGEIYMFNSTSALSVYLSNKAKTDDIFQWKGQDLTDPHLISDGYYKVNADKTYTLVDNSRGDITINQNGTYPVNYKANAIVNVQPSLQEKTITPTKSTQNVTPDSNYDGLSKVKVNAIPSDYIIPAGDININSNGTKDVTQYKNAIVNVQPSLQEKTVTPTKSTQNITPDSNYDGLSKVKVNPIPSNYIIPTGDITIEENGTKDVTQFKNAVVNVKGEIYMFNSTGALSAYLSNKAKTDDIFQWKGQDLTDPHLISDGYYKVNADKTYTLVDNSRGDITINQNGTYPVNYKANAIVNVQPSLQEKTITPTKSTQNVTPDSNYNGLSKVTVNPIPSNYIIPSGLKSIDSNGLFDVTSYSSAEVDVRGTPYTFNSTSSLSTYLSNNAKNGDIFKWTGPNNTGAGLETDTYYVVSKPSGGTATYSKINNDSAPSTITFYIDDSPFTTIKGYNWGGWVYSSNNTDGFAVGTNNIIYHPDASVNIQYNGANIKASDIIVSGRHYNTTV